MEFVKN